MNTSNRSDLSRWLWGCALAALALRLWIAATFPITGDEAYFYWWGRDPDWGYYDHPPMVGWWIAALLRVVGDSTFIMRWPATLLPLALGGLIAWAVMPLGRERAAWAVLLFWLAPINWLNVLITTDTPLMLWSVASVAVLWRAEMTTDTRRATWLHALSGVLLGLAFLSKYFAVVVGLAYAVYFVGWRRERWRGLALLVLCALPGPLINLWWNMGHGWANIMFNVFNRNEGEDFAWSKPGLYLLTWAYLLTPGWLWLLWRQRRVLWPALAQLARTQRLLGVVLWVSIGFFALLSLKKVVGLHWVLNIYPFVFVAFALAAPLPVLQQARRWMVGFVLLHVLAVAGLYSTQLSDWENSGLHSQIVRSYRTQALLDQVKGEGVVIMATAYTPASIYGHTLKTHVPVFGLGSFHARQDDLRVDFRDYDGRTVRILDNHVLRAEDYAPYFDQVRAYTITQDGEVFHVIEGQGFRWTAYRDTVLRDILTRWHRIPAWLPMTGSPFCERYCGALRCDPADGAPSAPH